MTEMPYSVEVAGEGEDVEVEVFWSS